MSIFEDLVVPAPRRGDLIGTLPVGELRVIAVGTVNPSLQNFIATHSGLDEYLIHKHNVSEVVVFDAGGEFADVIISAAMSDLTVEEEILERQVVNRVLEYVSHYDEKASMVGDIVLVITFDGLCEGIMHRISNCLGYQFSYLYIRDNGERPGCKLSSYRKTCLSLFAVVSQARMVLADDIQSYELVFAILAAMLKSF